MMRRAIAALIVTGLLVGACDAAVPSTAPASAGPTNAATTVPPASPSPSPIDASAPFLAKIRAADQGSLAITGSLERGSAKGALGGSLTFAGADSAQLLTVEMAGVSTTTATTRLKGLSYTKLGDGPWLRDAVAPPAESDLHWYLHGLVGVVDRGVESHDGVAAHRLEPSAGATLQPAALALDDPGIADGTVAVAFFATDDGTPLGMVVTASWSEPIDGVATPATTTMDLAFTRIGGDQTVATPDHVWQRFASKRFRFSIAYPDKWTADTTQRINDYLNGPGVTHVGGKSYRSEGHSLAYWTKKTIGVHSASPLDYVLLGNDPTTLDGAAAQMLTSTYHDFGQQLICYELVAVHDGYVYDIFWVSPVKTRDAGLVTYRQMLATYAFG
jgi:hypothetical protein